MVKSEKDVEEFLRQNQLPYSQGKTILGIVMPKAITYILGPVISSSCMKYHILHFHEDSLIVIGVNSVTGNMEKDAIQMIPHVKIQNVSFKKKMTHWILTVHTSDGDLEYRVNPAMVGSGWHKANLANLRNAGVLVE